MPSRNSAEKEQKEKNEKKIKKMKTKPHTEPHIQKTHLRTALHSHYPHVGFFFFFFPVLSCLLYQISLFFMPVFYAGLSFDRCCGIPDRAGARGQTMRGEKSQTGRDTRQNERHTGIQRARITKET